MSNLNITATDSAVEKIKDILAEQNDSDKNLRVFIKGGGCAGFSYDFMIDNDLNMDDFACNIDSDTKIVVDSMSAQYLNGAEIDYVEELMNNRFVIHNPNAASTCGCGSSFNPKM